MITSGDHAFADLAGRAKAAGLSVQVLTVEHPTGRKTLSRELAAAADTHALIRLRRRTAKPNKITPSTIAALHTGQQPLGLPAAA